MAVSKCDSPTATGWLRSWLLLSPSQLEGAALPCDSLASMQIAKWVYQQTERANGQVWVMKSVFQHLSRSWREKLSA